MKKHILLIDDDKNELTLFMDALRKVPHDDGFKCTYASSFTQAIEMLKYLVPDFIFADFNTSVTNENNLPDYLKGQQRFERTKLCLYTHQTVGESKNTAAFMNAFHIQKTSDIDTLALGLTRFFDRSSKPDYSLL